MDNKEALRIIVKEVMKAMRELNEASVTGNVAGYNTPNAFSGKGDDKKKKKRLVPDDYNFIDDLEEATELAENRWLQLKQDETRTNHKKLADATSKARKNLHDVKKYLDWCCRLRDQKEIGKGEYHVRMDKNMDKIENVIDEIRMKIKKLRV